jgi:hypothetical protein
LHMLLLVLVYMQRAFAHPGAVAALPTHIAHVFRSLSRSTKTARYCTVLAWFCGLFFVFRVLYYSYYALLFVVASGCTSMQPPRASLMRRDAS